MANYTQEGININTYKMLFETKPTNATIDMQLSKGLFEVDFYSSYEHNIIYEIIHKLIINPKFFSNIHKKKKHYIYSSEEEYFEFDLLSKYFKEIFKDYPDILTKLLDNYKLGIRAGTCRYSIILTCIIPNSSLIMGDIPIKDGRNILHRFVEIKYNDEYYILDIAKNIIMKKDDYYKLSRFKELNRINSEDLKAIYNLCISTGICDHTKIISMFGNELLNDLEKNNLIKKKNLKVPYFNNIL